MSAICPYRPGGPLEYSGNKSARLRVFIRIDDLDAVRGDRPASPGRGLQLRPVADEERHRRRRRRPGRLYAVDALLFVASRRRSARLAVRDRTERLVQPGFASIERDGDTNDGRDAG